ncbi:MAG: hypothetical protein AAF078_07360 [Planctomycetota bacterium]
MRTATILPLLFAALTCIFVWTGQVRAARRFVAARLTQAAAVFDPDKS